MIVFLIGKNKIYKTKLPNVASGNYRIDDENGRKLISIEKINGKCRIVSDDNTRIINSKSISNTKIDYFKIDISNQAIIKEAYLKEYDTFHIALKKHDEIFILYCSPICEKFTKLDINNTSEISIGSDTNCDIQFNSTMVKKRHAKIYYSNGRLMAQNYDSEYGTFINNKPVGDYSAILFNGDVLFLMGLKIIIMGKSIFINNELNKVRIKETKFIINDAKLQMREQREDDDSDVKIYKEEDYFSRSPRIMNIIEREKVKIDPPPQIQNKEGMPFIYLLGSTLSMGAVTLISGATTIQSLSEGRTTFEQALPSLLVTSALLFSVMVMPILNMRYDKKQKAKYEATRQKRYREYINSKMNQIRKIMEKQRKILFENFVSLEECTKIIMTRSPKLWERKIDDEDFLAIRLGIGDTPLQVDIQYPEKQFTMEDDNLIEMLNELGEEAKTLKNVPITVSLAKNNISALVVRNNKNIVEKFVQSVLLQLIAFHSYEDLKIVFLVNHDNIDIWERMKMLPHIWNNTKQIRFFADNYSDMKEISKYLEDDLKQRENLQVDSDYKSYKPYYLIITDDYKSVRNLSIMTSILKRKNNLGFSVFCITDNLADLPDECKTFITLQENSGEIFESEISSTNRIHFAFDSSYTFFFERICKEISDIPIKEKIEGQLLLPENYNFLEMYNVGRIEQLNTLERWRVNDSTASLQAPIGIDAAGLPIVLDIHEKFHGPHGLIAGSTGSGKSEFIITYILSLAINYHPDDVNFVLIDYKGGGLAGAFEKRNIKLPHLVGTITNIDTAELRRSLASIKSELRRRQVIFNEARNATDGGTIDIYKYQKLYHEGAVKNPIPHLLIICDEFAELKQQQSEFMDELISVARIGRSLGVHLILATQKPAGIVNDQIRSNSKFAICLRVQDREDSYDVIKRPDAAEIKRTGQFYMQVGNNEYFIFGQSAWAGALYIPSDTMKKKMDSSIKFISNIGSVIKQIDNNKTEVTNNQGEQLTNIVKYLDGLAKQEGIKKQNLWIDNIPENIFLQDIREKYKIENKKNYINPVIGEFDDPSNQRQGPVLLDLQNGGNTVIFGNATSGKETLLGTIVFDSMINYTAEEVQFYIFDFGSEALKAFKESPNVGDVIFTNDTEKIDRFFDMIQKEIRKRTEILSDYGGDYNLYINSNKIPMPLIVIMINNYEAFSELYGNKYDELLLKLTRDGIKSGIVFLITVSGYNDIRYRMGQNFKQKIALQLNREDDYINIFDGIGKLKPANIFGRGLVKLEEVYEFQTAKVCMAEEWNKKIQEAIEYLKQKEKILAKEIPVLPEKVREADIIEYMKELSGVPIGIEKNSLEVNEYDFKKNLLTIITGKSIENSTEFVLRVLEEIKRLTNVDIVVLDAEGIMQTNISNLVLDYKNFLLKMKTDLDRNKNTLCVIVGIDKFINDIESNFAETLMLAQKLGNYNFIIIDNFTRIKKHEYDSWYKNNLYGDTGIWVGNGIQDQYLINYNYTGERPDNNCKSNFGYVIKQGEITMIKLLEMEDRS